MATIARLVLLLVLLLPANAAEPGAGQALVAPPPYETGVRHAGGIGKYYLGREIAEVMGHEGAGWLERPEREAEEHPTKLLEALGLERTLVVADVGAGTGYHTLRMAPRVARVLAVDIQQEMLDLLRAKAAAQGIANVEAVLGTITDPKLPEASVDLVLMVDVYHEFDHPREMMTAIRKALKPGGRVVLVEFKAEDPAVPIKTLHKMSVAQARAEMASFGLTWVRTDATLPWQHILVFVK